MSNYVLDGIAFSLDDVRDLARGVTPQWLEEEAQGALAALEPLEPETLPLFGDA